MKIKAQIAMVINMDKCIGCHTCSVTCKNTWTNREGAEYIWFNNVETKPGIGYPVEWENQEKYKGGWELDNGNLRLKAGSRLGKLLGKLFFNPDLPSMDDYYEPWTYNYDHLLSSPDKKHQPVARPQSLVTGKTMDIHWGPNWEDELAGTYKTGKRDPGVVALGNKIRFEFEETFMAYLPRICEHCLNPGCVASCPSGAIYKRDEDGIVLVDQNACRGWRHCVTGCPFKKVYFNWKTQKAEKCIFCFPRIEAGMPTVCSETCSGRVRFLGVLLYDADQIKSAAQEKEVHNLYDAQLKLFLDPNDPAVIEQARLDGIKDDWLEAAKNSPVYELIAKQKVALPLHPEFRTMPMVWYIPPLSPLIQAMPKNEPQAFFPTLQAMRIPVEYLAGLLTAGNVGAVETALSRLLALRAYMRDKSALGKDVNNEKMDKLYQLLAIAKYDKRFVIPTSHKELYDDVYKEQGSCGIGGC